VKTNHSGLGVYHKLPVIKAIVKRSTTARKQRAIRNSFIPYTVFAERYTHLADDVIKAKWRAKLLDPTTKKIKHKGLVLMYEFRGVDLDMLELADAEVAFNQDLLWPIGAITHGLISSHANRSMHGTSCWQCSGRCCWGSILYSTMPLLVQAMFMHHVVGCGI
jgi:hypothetical protein